MIKPKVISIAAVSGGGKTTITKKLSLTLKNSKALFFDDYDFQDCPPDLIEWVNEGADYNLWNLDPMIHDVESIAAKDMVSYILLDYPFSYKNDSLKELIDFSIYIDTPLDVALARRLRRDYGQMNAGDILNDLDFYLNHGRIAYLEMEKSIKPNSNLVVDGTLPPDKIIEIIQREIENV
ncbi:hypothetical protein [Metabacillus indicus]|uniref:hypothetical protein n=1 Tax=Metabacillus indicus TaxID=246786 RepID=UPI00248FAAD8|nr:hypothetical protein [Metabacillus indicus]